MTITRSPAGTIQAKVASGPSAGDHDRPLLRRALGRARDERGTSLTELALVMPVLLLILFGMIDFGKAINYWIDETHLANEGARLAVVNSNPGAGLPTPLRLQTPNGVVSASRFGLGRLEWRAPVGGEQVLIVESLEEPADLIAPGGVRILRSAQDDS